VKKDDDELMFRFDIPAHDHDLAAHPTDKALRKRWLDELVDDESKKAELQTELTRLYAKLEEARKQVAEQQADWATLNGILNATAHEYEWCSEFEDRLHAYNQQFRRLKLEGRANQGVRRDPYGRCQNCGHRFNDNDE